MLFIIYVMAILSVYTQLQCISPELYQQEVERLTQNNSNKIVIGQDELLHATICELAFSSPEIMENVPDFAERIIIVYRGDVAGGFRPTMFQREKGYELHIASGALQLFSQQELSALIAHELYKCTEKNPSKVYSFAIGVLGGAGIITVKHFYGPELAALSAGIGIASLLYLGSELYLKQKDDFAGALVGYKHLITAYRKLQLNFPELNEFYDKRARYCQGKLSAPSTNVTASIRDAWNGDRRKHE